MQHNPLLFFAVLLLAGAHAGLPAEDPEAPQSSGPEKILAGLEEMKTEIHAHLDGLKEHLDAVESKPDAGIQDVLDETTGKEAHAGLKHLIDILTEEIKKLAEGDETKQLPPICADFADAVMSVIDGDVPKDSVDFPSLMVEDLRCLGRHFRDALGRLGRAEKEVEEEEQGEGPPAKRDEEEEEQEEEQGTPPGREEILEMLEEFLEEVMDIHDAFGAMNRASKLLREQSSGPGPESAPGPESGPGPAPGSGPGPAPGSGPGSGPGPAPGSGPGSGPSRRGHGPSPATRELTNLLEQLLKRKIAKKPSVKRSFDSLAQYMARHRQ